MTTKNLSSNNKHKKHAYINVMITDNRVQYEQFNIKNKYHKNQERQFVHSFLY